MPTSFITAFRLPLYVKIYILLSLNLLILRIQDSHYRKYTHRQVSISGHT